MIKSEGMDYIAAYKGAKSRVLSIVRELWFKLDLPMKQIWYNKNIRGYRDTIIINDAMMTVDYLRWIKENNPEARLIFWYWNNITERVIQPEVVKPLGYELWSYSERDCEKYGLQYNTTFYSQKYYEQCNVKQIENVTYDISFVGKDKGRMQIIEDLQKKIKLSVDAYYVADHFYEFYKTSDFDCIITDSEIDDETLRELKESRQRSALQFCALRSIAPIGTSSNLLRTTY